MVLLFYVKCTKNVKVPSGGRDHDRPELSSPCGRKFQSQFQFHTLPDDGRSISRNVAEKDYD